LCFLRTSVESVVMGAQFWQGNKIVVWSWLNVAIRLL
jgi:hypothetical protein